MTTKVTVDAHAGWPVEVTNIDLANDGSQVTGSKQVVPAKATQEFYIHSHRELHVKELAAGVQPATEEAIKAAGADVAPRVTPPDVDAAIVSEHYFTAREGVVGASPNHYAAGLPVSLGLLTICVLVLRNGFTVTGESACASPENFNADIGRRIAREAAVAKVWPLLGYELRSRLARGE